VGFFFFLFCVVARAPNTHPRLLPRNFTLIVGAGRVSHLLDSAYLKKLPCSSPGNLSWQDTNAALVRPNTIYKELLVAKVTGGPIGVFIGGTFAVGYPSVFRWLPSTDNRWSHVAVVVSIQKRRRFRCCLGGPGVGNPALAALSPPTWPPSPPLPSVFLHAHSLFLIGDIPGLRPHWPLDPPICRSTSGRSSISGHGYGSRD